jgi:hypothetical protein
MICHHAISASPQLPKSEHVNERKGGDSWSPWLSSDNAGAWKAINSQVGQTCRLLLLSELQNKLAIAPGKAITHTPRTQCSGALTQEPSKRCEIATLHEESLILNLCKSKTLIDD